MEARKMRIRNKKIIIIKRIRNNRIISTKKNTIRTENKNKNE